jgi:predicted phosphodiesterase
MAKAHNRSALRDAAVQLVKAMPTAQNRTLARRLAKEFGVTVEQARTTVRTVKGVKGSRDTAYAEVPSPKGAAGWKPKMPPSQAEPWIPYVVSGKRVAIMSDIHVPYHSEIAVQAAVSHLKSLKPDTLLLNGDICDFYSISRWQKNPKMRDMKGELNAVREMLTWLRAEFKNCEIIFKVGNHEERWDHWLWNHAPEISDCEEMRLETWLHFDKHNIKMVSDRRPVMVGKLPVLHGHELPSGISSPVNMARGVYMRTAHTGLVGHGHRSSMHTEPDMFKNEVCCWSIGCLCDLSPDYARINKWDHSCGFVTVADDLSFEVAVYRITKNGQVRR